MKQGSLSLFFVFHTGTYYSRFMVMQSSLHKGNLVVLSQKTQTLYVSHINSIVV